MEEPSSPSSADYQRILSVLRRDASLRCREQERIRRLRGAVDEEEEEDEEADRKALALARERRLNGRACVRCRRGFPRSGAILRCARCRFRICGDCCMPGDAAARDTCFCISCYREVQLKSGDWFYSQLRKRFGGFGVQPEEGSFLHRNYNKALAEEVDSETAKVREFVERLVEALVSGGLDNVNINRLYSHPEYDCMFSNYHSSLCDAIARLTIALQMSISHHPLPANLDRIGKTEKDGLVAMVGEEDDDGLLCSPSVAHAQLKTLVQQVIDEARELPRLGIQQFSSNGFNRRLSDEGDIDMENSRLGNGAQSEREDFASKTYEDILATAILNKVILQCQKENEWGPKKDAGGVDRNRNLLVDRVEVGVQAEVEAFRTRGDGCGPEGASAEEYAEEDEEDYNDNSNFNSFGRWRNRSQPISYTIEKKVEEVMTTYSSEDEENLVHLRPEDNLLSLGRDRTLSSGSSFDEDTSFAMIRGLAMHTKSAAFPEFGVDIIDIDDDDDHDCSEDEGEQLEGSTKNSSTTKISGIDSWEENWLFQRRRLKMRGALSNGGYCSVPMLVPNPSEDLHAQIGDVDAEEISDLSECNDSTEWDVNDEFTRSHHLSSSSASVISDSLSSEALNDPLLSKVPGSQECPVEAKNDGLLDFAEAHNHQQDSEYTEDYAVAEQRRLAMTPSPILNDREGDLESCSEILTAQKPVPRPRTQVTPLSRATSSPQKYIPPSNRQLPPSVSKMEILQAPESTLVHAGKTAHFILGLWSHLPANVWWFQEEFLLEEDDNHRIFFTALNSDRPCTQYHLEIFNTDPQNASGKYSVVAIDSCGNSIWQDFSLTVKGSRRTDFSPEFVVEPYDVTVGEGDEVEFLLEVKGYPEPKVSFWKGASLLHTSPDGYLIERQGGGHWTFRINKVTPMDGGKFVVEARNRIGVATATAEVQVVKLESASPVEESVPIAEEDMRALSTLEASSSVLQNGLQHQAAELQTSAQKLSQLISQLEDLEIHIHSMEAEFGSLHSDLDFGGVDMTTYISSPWSTPLSSVSSSPPSSLSTSSSQAISALEDSSLEQRKAHLQQLLSCLQKEVDEAEGSRDELSECSPKKEVHTTEDPAAPPRPGTIAEREHRKWASAPPIPDNPYSPEKISERLRSINLKRSLEASRGSCSDASIDFPEFHSESETREAAVPKVTINCGGKYLNPKKYGRDYYINSESDSGKHLVHRNKDRSEEMKQPDKMELIGNAKDNDDLNMRKKGLLVDAEISQLPENTSGSEKESIEQNETTKCTANSFLSNGRKLQDIVSCGSEATDEEIEQSKPKSTTGMVVNTRIPSVKDAHHEGLPTGTVVSGGYSSNNTNPEQKVLVNSVKSSTESSKSIHKRSMKLPETCGALTHEPRSLPVQISDDLPSLPSVRQLARQFSGASKSEETTTVPILKKKKKAPKEVVIVKKSGGLEARLDPPLQVEANDIIKHAACVSSSSESNAWNNIGFWSSHHSSPSLALHANQNFSPQDLHQVQFLNSETAHHQRNKMAHHKHEPCIPAEPSNLNDLHTHLTSMRYDSVSGNSLLTDTLDAKNCSANIVEVGVDNSSNMYMCDNEEPVGLNAIGGHYSAYTTVDNSKEKSISHSLTQDHNRSSLKMAQLSTKDGSLLQLPRNIGSAFLHQNNILCYNVTGSETMELLLRTGGCPLEQEEATGGNKSHSNSSEHISLREIVKNADGMEGYWGTAPPLDQDDCDFIVVPCGKIMGRKKISQVQEPNTGDLSNSELTTNYHSKELRNEVTHLDGDEGHKHSLPPNYMLLDSVNAKINNASTTDIEDTYHYENGSGKSSNECSDDSKSDSLQEFKKGSTNWDGIRLNIHARLGARTASGITRWDEENSGRKKKNYPVHSLTARSISREFREGLKQSVQVPLGKPVANPSEKLNIRRKPFGDQSQNSGNAEQDNWEQRTSSENHSSSDHPLLDSHSEMPMDEHQQTFNPAVSQERPPSADSLIAEMNGPFLRNVEGSIAFWERLSPLGASSTNHQKDV